MSKPTPQRGPHPDPMAGVVDRLLAQLPGLQGQPEPPRAGAPRSSTTSFAPMNIVPRDEVSPQRQALGMWFRVVLALSLAVTMGWWPYNRSCGFPLLGYLSAVTTVIVAGMWAATASWKVRSGLAHTIALILIFFGFLLAGSELLTRNGYAVDRATWQCEDPILDSTVSA
ncbi:MAG TPA: hypothetical protein VKB22_01435 [Gemmatimonadales bacterium]|nr:hypothetical protein [Gemmatimonadales bacterium]